MMLRPNPCPQPPGHRQGAISIHGPTTIDQTVQLLKLPAAIRRVLINYNYDVLCTDNWRLSAMTFWPSHEVGLLAFKGKKRNLGALLVCGWCMFDNV